MEDSYNVNDEEFKKLNNQEEESVEEENESDDEDGESQKNINLKKILNQIK